MNNNRKAWIVVVCLVLILLSTVFTTLAYLTDNDNKAVNTFTVGNVQIELYEYELDTETGKQKLDGSGNPIPKKADGSFTGFENVKLIPGRVVNKEPFIKVLANSENCYVRAIVTVNAPNKKTDFATWAQSFENTYICSDGVDAGFNKNNWSVANKVVDESAKTITYTLNYVTDADNIVKVDTDDLPLAALFHDIAVPNSLDNTALAELADLEITIVAQAIQAEGFNTEGARSAMDVAWEAFDKQVKSN